MKAYWVKLGVSLVIPCGRGRGWMRGIGAAVDGSWRIHFPTCTKHRIPPHPLRYAQHLLPSGRRLLWSMRGRSCQRQPSLVSTLNKRLPWHADRRSARAGEARPRGKAGSERRKAGFHPGGAGFHLPRGWPGPLPVFIQLTFTSHTGSLFLSLYAPRYCLRASAGFGRQFAKLRALSRLRRRYDSRKKRPPSSPHPTVLYLRIACRKPAACARRAGSR